ncbi:MAG: hypothetical protein ABN502_18425 [Gammaproteobacteria bacterium]
MARHLALLPLSMASVASAAEPQQAAMRWPDHLCMADRDTSSPPEYRLPAHTGTRLVGGGTHVWPGASP